MHCSLLNIDPAKIDWLDCPVKLTKYELNLIKETTDILTTFEVKCCNIKQSNSMHLWTESWTAVTDVQVKNDHYSQKLNGEKVEDLWRHGDVLADFTPRSMC